jgi:hypothetical protein
MEVDRGEVSVAAEGEVSVAAEGEDADSNVCNLIDNRIFCRLIPVRYR